MKIIDNYKDVPLGLYMRIDEVLRGNRYDEDIDKQVAIVALLTGKTEEEILALPLTDYAALAASAAFLADTCEPSKAAERYNLGGMTLVPTSTFAAITTAQYVDFQTFAKGGIAKLPELLSCLLVPEGKRYNDGYDILEVQALVKQKLMLPDALGLAAFFLTRLPESMVDSLTSSGRKMQRSPRKRKALMAALKKAEELLRTAGDGSMTSTS